MDYAVNPDTGEVVFLVNNKWVPPSDYAVNDKGQKAYLVGNRWEVPDIPTPQTGMGATVTDVGKLVGAGAISAAADVPKGTETIAAGMARQTGFAPQDILEYLADPTKITNKLASLVGLDKQLEEQKTLVPENTRKAQELAVDQALTKGKIQALEKLSQYGKGVSKDIESTVSPEMREAIQGAVPEGNIIKQLDEALVTGDFSGVSFGKAPSAQGYLGLGAKLLGSSLPALIGGVATKSPTTGGVLGGGAAATEAKDTAKEYISKMSDTELEEKSPYYKNLVAQGVNPTEARQLTIDKSGDVAGMYQGLTAALGSAFTTKLLMGQFNKKVIDSAKDRIYNAISGGVKGVAEESTQELMEGVAADLGINKTVVREIGVDSFANLVLGALGGGGPGVVGGLRGEKTQTALTTPQAPAQKFTTDEQGNLVPVPPAAPPAPIAPISTTAAQPELFTKEEAPYAVTQDETTAAQRQQAEIERNIDALRQQELAATSTDEKIALTEQIAQLESQLPEAPKDRATALGEEMMTLERKYKELEATRNATKPLKEKGALTEQMNTIRARQTEILAEGKQLQKQGVSFAPPEGQAALELEVPPVINDTVAQRFGFTPKAVKIKEAIRGLDMTKPEDRQKFRDLIEKHERKGAKVDMAAAEDYVNYFEEAPSGDIRTEPISRTGEPSIQVPSETGAPPTGTTTPVAGGLGSPVKSTGRVAGGEEVLGEDRTAPLKPLFREANEAVAGLNKPVVENIVADVTKDWVNKPILSIVQSETELPSNIQNQIKKEGVLRPKGVFDPDSNTVYVIANNAENGQDVVMTIAHELIGHFGLRSILGANYEKTMNQIYEGNKKVRDYADNLIDRGVDKATAVEETLAKLAETRGEPTLLNKIIVAIRKAFTASGFPLEGVTDSEVLQLLKDSRKYVIEGKGEAGKVKQGQALFRPTEEGQKAEEQFQQAGGVKKPPKPPAFIRKMQEWKSAYDNNMLVGSMFGKLQNAFSFDRAFSNRMRNTLLDIARKGDVTMEQAKTALLRISISQALYRSDFARKFLATGDYKYDATTNRWEAVQDDVNMDKFEGLAKDLAKRLGVDNETALGYMSKGYEAKRVIGFYDGLADTRAEITRTQKKIDVLKNKKRDKAEQKDFDKKKELLKALEDKANELESKAQHMTRAQAMKGMELYNDHPEIKEGAEIWNTIRKRVIKMLVETGVKSEEQAEKWLDEAAYVPFFRDIGEEKASGPQVMTRGIRETMADKRMKGSMLEVENTVGNMYQWVQWSVARAISNKQLTTMLAQYKAVLPDEVRAGKGPPDSTFSVYEDGVQKFYHVADPAIAQAFTGMESVIFPGIGAAMRFKNAFSHVITRVPIFPVAQLVLMDTWSAMSTSGLKHPFGIVKEIAKEVAKTAMGTSEARQKLTAASVLSTHEYSSLTDADDVAKRLDLSKPNAFRRTMNMLDKWAALNDNMLRQAVFAQAKNERLSDTEAMEKAVEIVNFRRMSGNAVLVFASKTVPFFNAYSQVLDATGRTLSGKGITPQERKTGLAILAATSAKLGILSFLYAAAVSDDEDYQKKNRLVRDRVFVIPGTGGLSVPLRYDLFLLPKIIGEYSYNLMADKGFVDSKMFKDAMARATKKQFEPPMGGVFAPAIGLATNHDFFFDREIVNASLRKLDPELQYTKSTSELSKVIGNYAKISPAKLDYFFNGYFGSFATLTALATNDLVAQARGVPRPARSVKEIAASLPSMGGFMDKQESVNAVADFYEAAREVNTTVDSYRVKAKADREAAKKYIKEPEHYKQAKVYEAVTGIGNALEGLKRQENAILESKMSSEEKRIELDKINKKKEKLTEPVRRVRKELGY